MKLKVVLWIIGISQLILGAAFMFFPDQFIEFMELPAINDQTKYLLAMLAARFFAYGVGMLYATRNPEANKLWIVNMILIQVIDWLAAAYYVLVGTVDFSSVAFAMFNATVFIVLLAIFQPRSSKQVPSTN